MSEKVIPEIAVIGIDIGKTSFHVIGLENTAASFGGSRSESVRPIISSRSAPSACRRRH